MFDDEDYSNISGSGMVFKAAMFLLVKMNKGSEILLGEEIAKIVQTHSIGVAISYILGLWMLESESDILIISQLICIGFIWSMYYRINSKLGVPFVKNIFESIGIAVCTNIAMGIVVLIAEMIIFSIVPYLGILVDTAIWGLLGYASALASGIIYLKILAAIEAK